MPSLFDWSSTAGSNTTVDGISIAEGMSPANVNNAMRSIMALVRSTFSSTLQTFLAGTSPLGLGNGGTGGTDAATARTALGALASTYRDLPIVAKTGSFAFADAERANLLRYSGGAGTLTIEPNATVAITSGGFFAVLNRGSGTLTTAKGAGVSVYIAGQTANANVTIPVGAYAVFIKTGTDEWLASGSGIS